MTWLLEAAGLAGKDALDRADLDRLYEEAKSFLDAFGSPTGEAWVGLHVVEREALAAAGRAIRKQQAVDTGVAAQGFVQAAQILAALDGGVALDAARSQERREKLVRAAKAAAARLESCEATMEQRA